MSQQEPSMIERSTFNVKNSLRALTRNLRRDFEQNLACNVKGKPIEDRQNIPPSPSCHVDEVLSSIDITSDTVRTKLNKLNPHKSPGNDKWHPYLLRELANTICVPLSILLNKSLKEGAHKSWLTAIITAIYKKGLRSVPGNYRPVSITSSDFNNHGISKIVAHGET